MKRHSILTTLLILLVVGAAQTVHAQGTYDRNEIPGHYTIGIYADEEGSSRELKLPKGTDVFEAWIGITGDSTKVFSAMVFGLELPPHVVQQGPIRWKAVGGLVARGSVGGQGLEIEFNRECQQQKGTRPVMMGRIGLRVEPGFDKAVIVPTGHKNFGLSVELCDDSRAWPKPYAEGLGLTVRRKLSWIDRIRSLFD